MTRDGIVEGEPPGAAGNPIAFPRVGLRRKRVERVVEGPSSTEGWVALARWLIKRAMPECKGARVDGFTDEAHLPVDAALAMAAIRDRAEPVRRFLRSAEPTYMAIWVPSSEAQDLVAFTPFSIHAEFVNSDGASVLTVHDTSSSISVEGTAEELAGIERDLPAGVRLR